MERVASIWVEIQAKGDPSKNKKNDKSYALKVTTSETVGRNSLGNIPKVVSEVDKMQVQDEQPQEYVVKEIAIENEDKENVAKMETDGGGPILGKRGRVKGNSSSKKGKERPRNKGARRWKKKVKRPVTQLSLPHEGCCLECKRGSAPLFCISNQEAFEKCSS